MFIDFEGIDGSGKTTLSNRVARRLRDAGHEVLHAREGGELAAGLSRRIRELTRDPNEADLAPEAELLLNAAREAQLVAQVIRPALDRGALVIADRSIDSHLALARARGLPLEAARGILDAAAAGLRADLVVLVDVDPDLARIRKRAGRLEEIRAEASSRKGLAGPALLQRMRAALLEAAEAEPNRFLVLRNEAVDLDTLEEAVVAEVEKRLASRPRAPRLPRRHRLPATKGVEPAPLELPLDRLEAHLLAQVERWAEHDPASAALLLSGVPSRPALELRRRLAPRAPAAVAASLIDCPNAPIEMLRELVQRAPRSVARALLLRRDPEADALRVALAERYPREILEGLIGRSDDASWQLRDRLWKRVPGEVLASLAGDDGERAWALRERARAERSDPGAIHLSLAGLDGERAWRLRREVEAPPPALLKGLRSCVAEASWAIRERWIEHAPRPILKGLAGIDLPQAWDLRRRVGSGAAEVLDSILGMRVPAAQAMRADLAPCFPARALKSLPRRLDETDRRLLAEVVSKWGGRLPVLRAAVAALAAELALEEAA